MTIQKKKALRHLVVVCSFFLIFSIETFNASGISDGSIIEVVPATLAYDVVSDFSDSMAIVGKLENSEMRYGYKTPQQVEDEAIQVA